VKDRYLVGSLAAGFAALVSGVLANALALDELGILAGIFGFGAAIGAAVIGGRLAQSEATLRTLTEERDSYRTELESLTALFRDDLPSDADTVALASPLDPESAVDPSSGLLDQQFFSVLVQQRVAAARRHLQPIAIVIFDIDGLDSEDTAGCDAAMRSLGATVTRTLRESDAACRVGLTMAAAILEDTAEAGAVWAAERIRGTLHQPEAGSPTLTVSAGIACYPTHALSAPELIDRAGRALDAARAHGPDRLEIATSDETATP
jgi:diguanylate cyclase (GGDEF)-like protein